MEDTFVHTVRSQAIDNEHLWKNVVFNRVTFSNMGTHAMSFHDKSQNASFTHCHFNQMNKTAIAVTDVANFLMAHNTFHSTCHPRAVEARYNSLSFQFTLLDSVLNEFNFSGQWNPHPM